MSGPTVGRGGRVEKQSLDLERDSSRSSPHRGGGGVKFYHPPPVHAIINRPDTDT